MFRLQCYVRNTLANRESSVSSIRGNPAAKNGGVCGPCVVTAPGSPIWVSLIVFQEPTAGPEASRHRPGEGSDENPVRSTTVDNGNGVNRIGAPMPGCQISFITFFFAAESPSIYA
jgi:hypothetical protein